MYFYLRTLKILFQGGISFMTIMNIYSKVHIIKMHLEVLYFSLLWMWLYLKNDSIYIFLQILRFLSA